MANLELPSPNCKGCQVAEEAACVYTRISWGKIEVIQAWLSCLSTWETLGDQLTSRDVEVHIEGRRDGRKVHTYEPVDYTGKVECKNP